MLSTIDKQDMKDEVLKCLKEFVLRASKGTTQTWETEMLPAIAKILLENL